MVDSIDTIDSFDSLDLNRRAGSVIGFILIFVRRRIGQAIGHIPADAPALADVPTGDQVGQGA